MCRVRRRPPGAFRVAVLGALLLPWAGSGCYSHRPVHAQALVADVDVRVRVTAQQREVLREVLHYEATTVQGRVAGSDAAELTLDVPVGARRAGVRSATLLQRFHLPWSEVIEVEARSLDRRKTTAAVSAAVFVVGAVALAILSGDAGGTVGVPPGGGDEDRVITVRPGGWIR